MRPEVAAWLERVPPASVTVPRPVAEAERQLRSGAQAGLAVLDGPAGRLQAWLDKIAAVPNDVGSADATALAHADAILGLLGHAQRMLDLPAELARQGEALEGLAREFRPFCGLGSWRT